MFYSKVDNSRILSKIPWNSYVEFVNEYGIKTDERFYFSLTEEGYSGYLVDDCGNIVGSKCICNYDSHPYCIVFEKKTLDGTIWTYVMKYETTEREDVDKFAVIKSKKKYTSWSNYNSTTWSPVYFTVKKKDDVVGNEIK